MKTYTYKIWNVNEKDRWLFVMSDDQDKMDLEEPDAFINFVKKIQSHSYGKVISVGDAQYKIDNDKYGLIYQWDDLFGIVVIYPDTMTSKAASEILDYYLNDSWHEWHTIYEDIPELKTPVGSFYVSDGVNKLAFSVRNNIMNIPIEKLGMYDNENGGIDVGITEMIMADNNYNILIPVTELEVGQQYTIQFTAGKWDRLDSDEHTVCYSTVIADYVVGIGAADPNDEEKMDQEWDAESSLGYLQQRFIEDYDETRFSKYTVEELDGYNGFRFKIYDYSFDYVIFDVAWLKTGQFTEDECTTALSCWLC